ncbi:hypothetical protein [uncultured Imperialibacter sp.]|uniref:hypothetical protein n=1 Tax=uncultured Imperialibacter sp. TaxID=1672639 RepID=UPI0030D7DE23|tara:strand:+ start:82756 stop:83979 length:1224 start_codon:yes stop_codon:yes gene_type:complete
MSRFDPGKFARFPLLYLVALSALGLLLRWQMVSPLPITYRYFVHAHSHTAFMGWVYNALFLLMLQHFVAKENNGKLFRGYFFALQIGVLGMLGSFPFQGYGPVAIAFSTLHMAVTIAIAVSIFKVIRGDSSLAASFLRWALVYELISGVGPLMLGPLSAMGLKDSSFYSLSIYFFMHFQFNGWFVLACLAMLFRLLERSGWSLADTERKWLKYTLLYTVGPAYVMSALWTDLGDWKYLLAMATGVLQIVGVLLLLRFVWKHLKQNLPVPWARKCLQLGITLLTVKYFLQLAGSIPGIDSWVMANNGIIIAFIHLIFIGVVSFMLLGFYILGGWLHLTAMSKTGISVFFGGFAITEIALAALPSISLVGLSAHFSYFETLVVAAAMLLIGSVLMALEVKRLQAQQAIF